MPKWLFFRSTGTMVFALILGTVLAMGHHFFYNRLAGQVPPDSYYTIANSTGLTGQQINLATGAIFVFLVKAILGVAISTAREQTVWRAIRNPNRTTKVATIDGLLSSTGSVLNLAELELWKRSFVSMSIGTFSWLLTIAFLFPASTLTIQSLANSSSSMLRVPWIDFLSMNFANVIRVPSQSARYDYNGPQFPVQATVAAAMAGSEILGITPPHPNSSWSLDFLGPALTCRNVNSDLHAKITRNIIEAVNSTHGSNCDTSYGYLSWTSSTSAEDPLPFSGAHNWSRNSPAKGLGPMDLMTLKVPIRPLSLYVAALPNMRHILLTKGSSIECDGSGSKQVANATIVECILGNASYVADFRFVDAVQEVHVERKTIHNNVSYLSGVAGIAFLNVSLPGKITDKYDTARVANFAYQAVMNAFNSLLLGDIYFRLSYDGEVANTSMAVTPLINTKELSFLLNLTDGETQSMSLAGVGSSRWNGLSVSRNTNFNESMVDVLETMFINSTISLMHSSLLNPNYSSPYAPGLVNVTISPYQTVYVYSSAILWVSYGAAIATALLSVCSGIVSTSALEASYTTKFSTILRMSHGVQLSAPLPLEEAGGEDPTPESVNRLEVRFPKKEHVYEALPSD